MTAAHCVYDEFGNGYGSGYKIRPGRNGNLIPWECSGFSAHVPEPWITAVNNGSASLETSRRYDWAAIDMRCRVGEEVGVFGFRSTNDGDLDQQNIFVTGYPVNSPDGVDGTTSMWTGGGNVVTSNIPGVLRYNNDTTPGQSGGPIWQVTNVPGGCSTPCIIGVNNAEVVDGVTPNYGARITPEVFSLLLEWREFEYRVVYVPLVTK